MTEAVAPPRPLSPAQEALWLAWRLDPTDPTYHVALAFRLEGEVDGERLEAAWRAVAARHVTLQGAYRLEGTELVRVPAAGGGVRFEHGPVPEGGLGAWATQPFELEVGPVSRAGLFAEGAGRVVLAGAVHHLACDGLSAAVLISELAAVYEGRPLPPLATSYDEHVERARRERVPAQPLDGPTPRLGPGVHLVRPMEAQLSARVRRTARALGVTPATVFQALFRAWLCRHTGEQTVAVPFAGRSRREWHTVGYFSEARLVPVALERLQGSLGDLVAAVGAATARARHGGTPARRFAGLFNALPPIPVLALDGVRVEPLRVPLVPRLAGIGLTVHERNEGHELEWTCAREAWREALPAWVEGFEVLAAAACEAPERSLRTRPVLSEARRRALDRSLDGGPLLAGDALGGFWRTVEERPGAIAIEGAGTLDEVREPGAPRPDGGAQARQFTEPEPVSLSPSTSLRTGRVEGQRIDGSMRALDSARAERRPGFASTVRAEPVEGLRQTRARASTGSARAGSAPGLNEMGPGPLNDLAHDSADATSDAWTYARLGREVKALAARLDEIPPGAIVTLDLRRSPWAFVALLATLERRLAYAFTGPGAAVPAGSAALVGEAGGALSDRGACPLQVERLSAPRPTVAEAAVVVSTSGSTGAPKPIVLARPAVESYAEHVRRVLALGPSDRVLQFHALTFDGHVEEILPALSAGAALVLSEGVLGAGDFFASLERSGVSVISLPTAYWSLVATQARALGLHAPTSLRACIVGGEAVTPSALEAWRAVAPHARFLNTYGPAEATVAVTTSTDETLGRPNPGARLSVRDAFGELVPEGVLGELWIDGPCVAPATPRPHRSGDLVRLRPDGALEFHGRVDRQLKVLGQRVEPSAVEAALVGAGARRAVVALRDGLLTAWIEGPLDVARLREALRGLTPASRPVRFGFVEALRLTPHGKIALAALEALEVAPLASGAGRDPAPGREARIAAVFAEALGLARVFADDDFFELGGDSLRGLECTVRLGEVLGAPVSLAALYAHSTPARLAQAALEDDEVWRVDVAVPVHVTWPTRSPAPPQRVLLTGATGLVGAHLLDAWLERPGTHVTCLVRAPSEAAARHRLEEVGERYGLALDLSRIGIWAGELATLPGALRDADLDAVVHAAGCTELRRTYAELRPSNVDGVRRVLELGLPVHLVSSLSAVESASGAPPAGAYPRSKWVAERLADSARAAGASVWTYRMGRVWGSQRVGVTPESDALWAAARRGMVPLEDAAAAVIPADVLARELVRLAFEAPPGTYSIERPARVDLSAYRRRIAECRRCSEFDPPISRSS